MHITEKFTDRDDWHKMIFDEEHVLQWREEMLAIPDRELKNIVYTGNDEELILFEPMVDTGYCNQLSHIKFTGIINNAVLDFVCSHSGETC